MKVGDRVTRKKVLKNLNPVGTVIKITKNEIVVSWDSINGQWHYTNEQSKKLEVISEQ